MIKYVLCVGAGLAAGYFIAQQQLEAKYYDDLAKETEEIQDFYRRKYVKEAAEAGEDPEVTESAVSAAEALERYQGITAGPGVLTEVVTESLKRDAEAGEDPQEVTDYNEDYAVPPVVEKPKSEPVVLDYNQISTPVKVEEPDESRPHVITVEEFIKNTLDYKQFSITYYAGDDILAGQSDNIIDKANRKLTLGDQILEMLKAGPDAMGGMDVIFVRCPMMSYEFEIARSTGKYVDEVGPIPPSSPSG